MESLEQLSSLKCPLCNKSLANKEYKIAIAQLEEQLQKNFDQKNESQKDLFKSEIQALKEIHEKSMKETHETHKEQLARLRHGYSTTCSRLSPPMPRPRPVPSCPDHGQSPYWGSCSYARYGSREWDDPPSSALQ